ncbi:MULTISPECIES: helix-turn-helix domain-containing protein [unclassified Bradyrhizobium]|uniref:helix-turn-helix domain-containing protein n=1 Tax=unclassified Bradyrhizobium TaxID=2631580 RepID=UPI002306CC2F|nr:MULTISPECIES: AraC family transcriptional regulator [unclassified Bradyrhizobium]MDA9410741.1 AraC family transcriptional regulator [Bradyrhizobium sp. CCBAU 45384]MDA9445060.1 AraC family transcriptional regulator [Bradyrhizobium sp. CCBAU 51745]
MTRTGAYGERFGEFLRLEQAPPSLLSRSLRSTEIAVTETRNHNPVPGLSGSFALEDAYLVSLKLRDYPACEIWEQGRHLKKTDVHAGTTYLYDLKADPRYVIDKPFHSLHFYVPHSALDSLADQSGARRIDALDCRPVGHDDAIVRHIGASLREGLRRPDEANQLFTDHMMLALTAHVAQTYGGFRQTAETGRGALAPWQLARACDKLEADLGGKLPLQAVAAELGLSVSHFSRAFRASTGLPPYRWLLHHRVRTAKRLMGAHGVSLSEVAISAGFANQSHFTRVFSAITGVSPGAWRRDALGATSREG